MKSTKRDTTEEEQVNLMLSKMPLGGIWQPEGHGLTYMKIEERTVELMVQKASSNAAESRLKMGILLAKSGWHVKDKNVQILAEENLSPQQQYMEEQMRRQEIAQTTWKCQTPECGCLLSAFPLEEGEWVFVGQENIKDEDDQEHPVEIWAVNIQCPVCDTTIAMEPLEFAMLAGDDVMMKYKTPKGTLEALDRVTIINSIDSGDSNIIVTGTFCPFSGVLLPPHVRGAVVRFELINEEE